MKRFMTLLLAMLMVLSLAACGDKPSATVDAEGLGKALTERVQFDSTMSAIDAGDYLELPRAAALPPICLTAAPWRRSLWCPARIRRTHRR